MASIEVLAKRITEAYKPPDTGRHSDLADYRLVKDFLTAVSKGNYLETACHISGLSKQTVYRWIKEAESCEDTNDARIRFSDAYENVRARAEAEDVANVRKAGKLPQFWAASATHLERRYPERWGKRPETTDTPRVMVIFGAQPDHQVTVQAPVNVMPYYQTQSLTESHSTPTVTDSVSAIPEAKALGESDTCTSTEPVAGK